MGVDTMLSKTGKELVSRAWYPIELTSRRKYVIPNDEAEQERLVQNWIPIWVTLLNNTRLDIVHHVYLLLLDGKLVRAPVDDNIQRILDIGTGTGIWAIDAAE